MTRTGMSAAMVVMCGAVLCAQAPAAPKPGPEHQALSAFVGNWTSVGEMKPGPMGPGGKMTGSDRIQWTPGNFAVERRFEGKGPMGAISGLEIIAYDTAKKTYTYQYVDSTGAVGGGTVTAKGNGVWNFSGSGSIGGQTMQERCLLTFGTANNMLKISCEMMNQGKWAPMFEGTATKSSTRRTGWAPVNPSRP